MTLKIQSLNSFMVSKRIHTALNKVNMNESSYALEHLSSHSPLSFTNIPAEGYLFLMDGIQTKGVSTWVIVDEECSNFCMMTDSGMLDRQTVLMFMQAIYLAEETAYIKGIEKGKLINKNELRKFLGLADITREKDY